MERIQSSIFTLNYKFMFSYVLSRTAILLIFTIYSCTPKKHTDPDDVEHATIAKLPVVLPSAEEITKSYTAYYHYNARQVFLFDDYQPLDENKKPITKKTFFEKISTGNYFPLKIVQDDSTTYQLHLVPTTTDAPSIKAILVRQGLAALAQQAMIGKPLPNFNFKDIEGNTYTAENTKGKLLIFDTWFTNCSPCIAEMPKLNEIVYRYKARKDILFLSLALDEESVLKTFLTNIRFSFSTIANKRDYVFNTLKIESFPTKFIVNRQGNIATFFSSEQLDTMLNRYVQ
jgi:thiol-disulfide isomerase/thioredoxin